VLDVESPSSKTFHDRKMNLYFIRGAATARGKTGGDGIHYNSESGEAWAKPVNATLDQILAADIAARRKLASNH
jgi:hypothetical protein